MNRLQIAATKSSPAIDFDPSAHRLSMIGQSYPENAFKFYEPIFEWVDSYLQQLSLNDQALLELQMPYINTSSTKCLLMLLEKLDDAWTEGKKVAVRWLCDPENESEFECAEELKEDLGLPFQIISKVGDS